MFGISVSGIKGAQKHIDVTSNNIANTNSYGFKKSRAEFADVYANSVFVNSKTAAGMGVYNSVVSQQFVQGNLSGDTGNPLDMAIQGNGFFVLKGAPGDSNAATYTRNGAFQVNKEGFIVTAQGDYLQGWDVKADGTTQSLDLNATHAIKLPADTGAPKMSNNVTIGVNLPADKKAVETNFPAEDPWKKGNNWAALKDTAQYGIVRNKDGEAQPAGTTLPADGFMQYYTDFDPTNPSTYTASTSQTIHDSLGGAHTLTYYMIKMGPTAKDSNSTAWTVVPYVDGKPVDVAKQNGQNPVCISVPENSKSSVAGANFFGFRMVFDSSGRLDEQNSIPGKVELVNFADGDAVDKPLTNSLRHGLFGYPGTAAGAPAAPLDAIKDPTFETHGVGDAKKPLYANADGSLYKAIGTPVDPHQSLSIAMNATQYGSSNFSVTTAPTDDGYSTGILTSMSVDENGIISCEFSNGQMLQVAKVAMADFTNQQGLTKIGDTQWKESNASGQAIAKEANSGSAGSIKGSNLELSNVDLTNELVELITAQRNYQANAQSLQTQSTVMDAILNVR